MTSDYSPFFEGTNVKTLTLDQMGEDGSLLNMTNFDYNLGKGKTLVMFYASWCGHCQSTKPAIIKLANILKKEKEGVNVAGMDMSMADEILISRVKKFKYPINGYPTIIGFLNGKPYSIYSGDRSVEDLYNYVKNIGNKWK